MLFSLLIANYNNGDYFKQCYQSIISQTYKDIEIIIVDDASTDNSLEIISTLIEGDHRFKLFVNSQNKGCGYTKNRCATLGNGEVMGFLDPDDRLKNNAIELMVNAHLEYSDVSIVTSKYEFLEKSIISNQGSKIPDGSSLFNLWEWSDDSLCDI